MLKTTPNLGPNRPQSHHHKGSTQQHTTQQVCHRRYHTQTLHLKQKKSRLNNKSKDHLVHHSKRSYNGKSPREIYKDGVAQGILRRDPRQHGTIVELDRLYQDIIKLPEDYLQRFKDVEESLQPPPKTTSDVLSGLLGGFLKKREVNIAPSSTESEYGSAHAIVEKKLALMHNGSLSSVRGRYIHGGVGCGKTMMMDMFFDQLPPNIPKVRKHFHTFMLEIHSKLHAIRQDAKRTGIPQADPLITIANDFIGNEGIVLCLDEFQVTDVADAMILKELSSGIFAAGGIIISTSNRHPDDLYKNGINRDSFLPFIDILKERCEIISMDDMVDYRTLVAQEEGLIHTPLNNETRVTMQNIYDKLAFGQDNKDRSHIDGIYLEVIMGRKFHVKNCVPSRVARFHFMELCDNALGAADYLAIAKEFPCILLENIPILYKEDSMALRRFITLLDVLYEHRTKMYISADAIPEKLFKPTISRYDNNDNDDGDESSNSSRSTTSGSSTSDQDINQPQQSPTQPSNQKTSQDSMLTAVLNKDEVFASARALSRLTEMMSTTYLSGQFHQQGSKDTKSKII